LRDSEEFDAVVHLFRLVHLPDEKEVTDDLPDGTLLVGVESDARVSWPAAAMRRKSVSWVTITRPWATA
jgi:hypothetical protein